MTSLYETPVHYTEWGRTKFGVLFTGNRIQLTIAISHGRRHRFENGVQNNSASGRSRIYFVLVTFCGYICRKLNQKLIFELGITLRSQ